MSLCDKEEGTTGNLSNRVKVNHAKLFAVSRLHNSECACGAHIHTLSRKNEQGQWYVQLFHVVFNQEPIGTCFILH
jgi:hypothetical protein